MNVNFDLLKNKHSWNSTIHQLNSDVLTRHVLMKGNVDIKFTYCEKTGKGDITNADDKLIGNFTISY
ncbi:hypothetical protein SKA34_16865 [Photobacterium sp. SKA34]|uniref:hypothetical protein n=1 Tax=Photobacterium sp. SKA34 TaxID=121723 RepID=UPI00006BEB33|nr:hypothetical protein [Photobacterium sp. SKA34]EAR55860.1 hypothetical protein SKA34_16865 [Photobacterium sp. SKA34]